MYSARFVTRQACRHAHPERWTHADDEDQDHDTDQADRRPTSSTLGRRGDRMPRLPAVLRAQPRTSALAVLSPVLPSPRRSPSAAHIAATALAPVSGPRAVPPRRRVGLDAPTTAAPIGRRAIAVRRHQPATPDARNVSATGHPTVLVRFCFFQNQRGRRLSHGGRRGRGWGLPALGVVMVGRRRRPRPGRAVGRPRLPASAWCRPAAIRRAGRPRRDPSGRRRYRRPGRGR